MVEFSRMVQKITSFRNYEVSDEARPVTNKFQRYVYEALALIRWVLCQTFLRESGKLRKATIGFLMSVYPHRIIFLPLDGFSRNLVFEDFFRKSVEKIQVLF
jgi:hypothetical protein